MRMARELKRYINVNWSLFHLNIYGMENARAFQWLKLIIWIMYQHWKLHWSRPSPTLYIQIQWPKNVGIFHQRICEARCMRFLWLYIDVCICFTLVSVAVTTVELESPSSGVWSFRCSVFDQNHHHIGYIYLCPNKTSCESSRFTVKLNFLFGIYSIKQKHNL